MRVVPLVLAAGLIAGCGGGPTPPPAVTPDTVAGQDVRLSVRTTGAGDDVLVLVHGGPGLSKEAMAPYEALAGDGHRVVSYDQRGSGRSTAPADGDYGLDAQIADLDAVRAAAGADRVSLLGQSWGGLLAMAYAAAHPERVRALVLVGSAPLDLAALDAGQARFADRVHVLQDAGRVPRPLPTGLPGCGALAAVLPAYAADPAAPPEEPAGTTCTPATSAATWADALEPRRLARAATDLQRWRGPAVALMGERDPFGLDWLDSVVRAVPGAQRQVVPGAGHLVVLDRPQSVLTLARAALR